MPVSPTYPGVYIEEVPSGVHTITGVATSIAAFLGRASKGPINKAVRILSPADYKRTFGDPHPKSDLADSVRLFFINGGTEGYVIRLAKNAQKAQVTLESFKNMKVLVATAKAEGVWGNTVRLEVDYDTPNPDESFNLRVIQEADGKVVAADPPFTNLSMNPASPRFAPNFVTQSSELISLELHSDVGPVDDPAATIHEILESFAGFSQARRPLRDLNALRTTLDDLVKAAPPNERFKFDISVNGAPYVTVDLTPWPDFSGAANTDPIKDHIQVQINTALAGVTPAHTVTCRFESVGGVENLLTITSASGDESSVQVRRSASKDISAALMLGVDQGGIEPVRWSNFRPAPTATILKLGVIPPTLPVTNITQTLNLVSDLNQDAITSLTIDGVTIPLDGTTDYNLVTTAAGDDWFKSKPVPGTPHEDNDGVREKLRIMAQAINTTGGLPYRAEVWGYHLAVIAKEGSIDKKPGTFTGAPASSAPFINGLTINVRQYSLGTASGSGFVSDRKDGDDGKAPGAAEYLGDPAKQSGLYALDPVDLFNLMVIPGDEEVGQAAVLDLVLGPASVYCQTQRAFLLIDAPKSWIDKDGRPEVVQNTSLVNDLRSLVVKDYSAVFFPRLRYAANGLRKTIGPAGAVAGLMARIDSTRGVWKAPAGLEADLRGILGLELKLTDGENGVLNKLGVNCLRVFPSGFITWGSRTLAGSDDNTSEWKYIPIRRFALFLEESLFRGTKWVVFEPNDEPLWATIRLNLKAFMMGLFRQGAFQGSTPDQAFYVKCDSDTTTQADRNLGIVNIEVGFAPLKPAEFVIIRIQQIPGQL